MTDREKLIELLNENFTEYCKVDIIAGHCKIRAITFEVDRFADYLISNGVTIPVHCKDCTNWKRTTIDCGWCSAWEGMRYHNNYCNYGARKENNNAEN